MTYSLYLVRDNMNMFDGLLAEYGRRRSGSGDGKLRGWVKVFVWVFLRVCGESV